MNIISLDVNSGALRRIDLKGFAETSVTIVLTPNERRAVEDRRECYRLYIVTNCATKPTLRGPIKDPALTDRQEVRKTDRYYLLV